MVSELSGSAGPSCASPAGTQTATRKHWTTLSTALGLALPFADKAVETVNILPDTVFPSGWGIAPLHLSFADKAVETVNVLPVTVPSSAWGIAQSDNVFAAKVPEPVNVLPATVCLSG